MNFPLPPGCGLCVLETSMFFKMKASWVKMYVRVELIEPTKQDLVTLLLVMICEYDGTWKIDISTRSPSCNIEVVGK